jgi:hypothetical protein
LKAVLASGQELKVPVVVGASEGEREFFGVRQIAALVRSLREECDCPIFLNADHTHSLAKAVEAARAGFDAIVFDLSALPFEQNVRQTKEAASRRPAGAGRAVEGAARPGPGRRGTSRSSRLADDWKGPCGGGERTAPAGPWPALEGTGRSRSAAAGGRDVGTTGPHLPRRFPRCWGSWH